MTTLEQQLSLLDEINGNSQRKPGKPASNSAGNTKHKSDSITQLLQLLSVIYEPVAVTNFVLCLNAMGIKHNDGKVYNAQKLTPLLKKLIKKGDVKVENKKYFCHPLSVEKHTASAVADGVFDKMANVVQKTLPLRENWKQRVPNTWQQAMRELRIAIYQGNGDKAIEALDLCYRYFSRHFAANSPFKTILFSPFDAEKFKKLPNEIASHAVVDALNNSLTANSYDIKEFFNWLIEGINSKQIKLNEQTVFVLCFQLLLRGEIDKAVDFIQNLDEYYRLAITGVVRFLQKNDDEAIRQFEQALVIVKKASKKRKVFVDPLCGQFFILALIRRGDATDIQQAKEYLAIHQKNSEVLTLDYWALSQAVGFMQGNQPRLFQLEKNLNWPENDSIVSFLLKACVLYWLDKEAAVKKTSAIKRFNTQMNKLGYQWLVAESSELLVRLDNEQSGKHATQGKQIRESCKFETMLDVIQAKESWERTLDAIANMVVHRDKTSGAKQSRLVWILSVNDSQIRNVVPKEQKVKANGDWSVGRVVALKRLYEEPESLACLTDHDFRAFKAIEEDRDYWGRDFFIDEDRMLPLLVGHPYLFLDDKLGTHIELTKGVPEIQVIEKNDLVIVNIHPQFSEEGGVFLNKESETRWRVYEATAEQMQLSHLIGDGLKIPKAAKDKVLESISAVAPFVHIHSDIGGNVGDVESVMPDNTIHLLLSPVEDGLKIEARLRLFGSAGPYYYPGHGGRTVIAEVDGKRLQVERDLNTEQENLQAVVAQCALLAETGFSNHEWVGFEPEVCLEVLAELKDLQGVVVSWPEGEALKIRQSVSFANLSMSIKKEHDWFAASGELKLDDGEVLNMKRLLELARTAKGRFISLADGQYLALEKSFKQRLAELDAFGDVKDDEVILHPLAALALDEASSEVGKFKSDKAWKSYATRFHEAMKLIPETPSTLQTELRDYQKQGFQWMVRLAHWGVGGCLADDMGLGKTVQAIAVLLRRATTGPALVVAPTSVAMNWMDEISRFAPTLQVVDYRDSDRAETLKELGEFAVVICSYGLLQNNIDNFADVDWKTVILDEAQAIKNSATKRSQAVMRLNAEFKLALTGTPIENHLGELWNLFRFINPGLLGSAEKFNQKYANPIVKAEAVDIRQKLKKLIQPYILRRTKTQVLTELPERTEITLQVEMSQEEASLYESLRRDAIEKFNNADLPQGHRQLQILAEITRLRRACCNPALVLKTVAPASSKLTLFAEVVEELLDNNHKALVFSQFVDHLAIIREKLESMGVKYQYLDGSTSANERKKRVTEFQSGIGDLFLISLKAGGVGLNLTAADYVIHMDPWWNPAVEDQASDRAHRIGQKRPVTIYRMITKNTIEEKIVSLHRGKRDLADNLLAGTDMSSKVDVEELLGLLREN